MPLPDALSLCDYWLDHPPPHIALVYVAAGLGVTVGRDKKPAEKPSRPDSADDMKRLAAMLNGM
jgi:hypothetical protein